MSEEFYIGLNLFSVFLASCTQVVLKKSAMNDRLTGLAYLYILLFDRIFFGKPITMRKVGGNVMIIAGIIVCLNR